MLTIGVYTPIPHSQVCLSTILVLHPGAKLHHSCYLFLSASHRDHFLGLFFFISGLVTVGCYCDALLMILWLMTVDQKTFLPGLSMQTFRVIEVTLGLNPIFFFSKIRENLRK